MRFPPHDKHPFWTILKDVLRMARIIIEIILDNR